MPQLIRHIDEIARQKQREVIFLGFSNNEWAASNKAAREKAITWLEANTIPYEPCGLMANEQCMPSYEGHLYLDIPHDQDNPLFQTLLAHFENEDGSSKVPHTLIYSMDLSMALKNKHHDEPGFWERQAENF